jgi:hypothetical protein
VCFGLPLCWIRANTLQAPKRKPPPPRRLLPLSPHLVHTSQNNRYSSRCLLDIREQDRPENPLRTAVSTSFRMVELKSSEISSLYASTPLITRAMHETVLKLTFYALLSPTEAPLTSTGEKIASSSLIRAVRTRFPMKLHLHSLPTVMHTRIA